MCKQNKLSHFTDLLDGAGQAMEQFFEAWDRNTELSNIFWGHRLFRIFYFKRNLKVNFIKTSRHCQWSMTTHTEDWSIHTEDWSVQDIIFNCLCLKIIKQMFRNWNYLWLCWRSSHTDQGWTFSLKSEAEPIIK